MVPASRPVHAGIGSSNSCEGAGPVPGYPELAACQWRPIQKVEVGGGLVGLTPLFSADDRWLAAGGFWCRGWGFRQAVLHTQ